MSLLLKVSASLALVAVVLWWMWRRPVRESLYAWAPGLALSSAWLGLISAALSAALWVLPYPDRWVTALFLLIDPAAGACAILTFWILREQPHDNAPAQAQRLQATVGLALTLLAVALGYAFVLTSKAPFTPVGAP